MHGLSSSLNHIGTILPLKVNQNITSFSTPSSSPSYAILKFMTSFSLIISDTVCLNKKT